MTSSEGTSRSGSGMSENATKPSRNMHTPGALRDTADRVDADGWSGRTGRSSRTGKTCRTLLFSSGKEYDIAHRWVGRARGEGDVRKEARGQSVTAALASGAKQTLSENGKGESCDKTSRRFEKTMIYCWEDPQPRVPREVSGKIAHGRQIEREKIVD